MTIRAAAPSLSGQQLPAVTVPSGRNTGFRPVSDSTVTPRRGPSSALTTVPPGSVIGVMSVAKNPFAIAAWASCWLRAPNSSCRRRLTFLADATFSAVWPIAIYTSGSRPAARGSVHAPVGREAAKTGFFVSGMPSDLPRS